jgi:hypothetical protein
MAWSALRRSVATFATMTRSNSLVTMRHVPFARPPGILQVSALRSRWLSWARCSPVRAALWRRSRSQRSWHGSPSWEERKRSTHEEVSGSTRRINGGSVGGGVVGKGERMKQQRGRMFTLTPGDLSNGLFHHDLGSTVSQETQNQKTQGGARKIEGGGQQQKFCTSKKGTQVQKAQGGARKTGGGGQQQPETKTHAEPRSGGLERGFICAGKSVQEGLGKKEEEGRRSAASAMLPSKSRTF